jgi:hypothetical protein
MFLFIMVRFLSVGLERGIAEKRLSEAKRGQFWISLSA